MVRYHPKGGQILFSGANREKRTGLDLRSTAILVTQKYHDLKNTIFGPMELARNYGYGYFNKILTCLLFFRNIIFCYFLFVIAVF